MCKRDASLDVGASIDRSPRNEVTSSLSVLRPFSAYKSNGCAKTRAFVYDVCAFFYDARVVADRKIDRYVSRESRSPSRFRDAKSRLRIVS